MKELTEQEALLRLTTLCSQSEHCQWEMTEKLRRWGISEEAQARIMQYLTAERYIDDARFCRAFVHDKIKYNKWGRRKVEQALMAKRIDREVCRSVLDEVDEGREAYLKKYSDRSRYDTRNYDVVLSMDHMTEDDAVAVIMEYVGRQK